MFLNGENVDVMFLTARNDLLRFMPDTSIGLTDSVGQGPNVVCVDIECLADIGSSSNGGWIRVSRILSL